MTSISCWENSIKMAIDVFDLFSATLLASSSREREEGLVVAATIQSFSIKEPVQS